MRHWGMISISNIVDEYLADPEIVFAARATTLTIGLAAR